MSFTWLADTEQMQVPLATTMPHVALFMPMAGAVMRGCYMLLQTGMHAMHTV